MKIFPYQKLILAVILSTSAMLHVYSKQNLDLQLPPAIYATPGIESNIYFDNIILTLTPGNYFYDVDCQKGYNDAKRWRYVPTAKDIGEYPLHLKIYDSENKLITAGKTTVIVSPVTPNKNKHYSLLLIGDSLTDQTHYPRRIYNLFKSENNPSFKFVGSHSGGGKPVSPGGVCHEGYGGWSWLTFCGMWSNRKDYRAKSKFLTMKDNKKTLDFQAYFDKYNKGKAPDFVTIMLGTNDIFAKNDTNIDKGIKNVFYYMDKFLTALTAAAPHAKIGIALTVPPAHSQDAFSANYKCGQTRWQFKRNQHRLVREMIKKFASTPNKNISLIPTYVNLDCENNFPTWNEAVVHGSQEKVRRQRNGVHPSPRGYCQIGDSFYNWLNYQLNARDN
jgi:lysophospholipase L1-like esterase